MKYTILSQKQSELLVRLLAKHGQIVSFDDILIEAKKDWDYQQTKNTITGLVRDGWLIRVKKGLYSISDLSNRGFLSLSIYVVAGLLEKDSYVSFETALQYHGMFDQLTNKTTSISLKRRRVTTINRMQYTFVQTKNSLMFGWQEVILDNQVARIATAEKALIDIINFKKNKYSIDLVIETIQQHKQDLNIKRMVEYLKKFSITTIKIFGYIFDILDIDSSKLYQLVKDSIIKKHSTHRMLKENNTFNNKWRLYYDAYFDKYKNS